jgi:hypothetical protein
MEAQYEYKFVLLDDDKKRMYHETTEAYAQRGWRLIQVLAPGAGGRWGGPDYVELVFERSISSQSPDSTE